MSRMMRAWGRAISTAVGCAVPVVLGVLLVACGQVAQVGDGSADAEPRSGQGPAAVSHGGPVSDHVSFVDNLRKEQMLVEPVADISRPGLPPGTRLRLTGDGLDRPAAVESYPGGAAALEASRAREPGPRRERPIRWFGTGDVLVRYAGTDPAAITLLTDLLGPPLRPGGSGVGTR